MSLIFLGLVQKLQNSCWGSSSVEPFPFEFRCIRLDSKANGLKVLMPIRPIAVTAGIMDIGNTVIRMT